MIKTNKLILDLCPNFSVREKWGDYSQMNPALLVLLQRLRTDMKAPFNIHCGYEVTGHSSESQHYLGNAVDFTIGLDDFVKTYSILNALLIGYGVAYKVGFGVYPFWNTPGFHLDVRGSKARWSRDREGRYKSIDAVLKDV